jgi:hypothetical protein
MGHAKISRKLAKNNSFVAEFEESIEGCDRRRFKEKALKKLNDASSEVSE